MENGFGAQAGEISGDFGQIWRAFFAAQVLVFRAQQLTAAPFLAFARRFGRPEPHVIDHHATQQKYQLRLKYGVGDTVIWDNASLLHSATLTAPDDPRTLWRITVKEEGR
jgi:alpha-ketoglutarate-dependent taurine dioxygenase